MNATKKKSIHKCVFDSLVTFGFLLHFLCRSICCVFIFYFIFFFFFSSFKNESHFGNYCKSFVSKKTPHLFLFCFYLYLIIALIFLDKWFFFPALYHGNFASSIFVLDRKKKKHGIIVIKKPVFSHCF